MDLSLHLHFCLTWDVIFLMTTLIENIYMFLPSRNLFLTTSKIYSFGYTTICASMAFFPWSRWFQFGRYMLTVGYFSFLKYALYPTRYWYALGSILFAVGSIPFTVPYDDKNALNRGGLSFLVGSVILCADSICLFTKDVKEIMRKIAMLLFLVGRIFFVRSDLIQLRAQEEKQRIL